MFEHIKIKILIILLAATLIIPAFLMAYQPKDRQGRAELAQGLWGMIETSGPPMQKAVLYSKDFPAGFKDASMGTGAIGPIKVEGG